MEQTVLEVRHLTVGFPSKKGGFVPAVNDVSFLVPRGSIVGIVGESGCGKSMTARSIMGLVKSPGRVLSGSIRLEGRELVGVRERTMSAVRGEEIAMIFQEPMTSLNPVMTVGRQALETVRLHRNLSKRDAKDKVIQVFRDVGISEPEKRYRCYPHELSGGLRQRVMIAMAMVCRPKVLIADEPTTALDVTVEAQILQLVKNLRDTVGTSMILISHNLGVVAEVCDAIHVMYAGRIVESGKTVDVFEHPCHPYTRGLLNAVRSLEQCRERLDTIAGTVPDLSEIGSGCAFAPRCTQCAPGCLTEPPGVVTVSPWHTVRCHGGKEGFYGGDRFA